jgi:biotin carboxyl carrier protein
MQNALLSPRTGKVKKIYVSKGSTVQADDTLIEFE